MYKKFLNWVGKNEVGDFQVIFGIELVVLAIILFYKFFTHDLSISLKVEYYFIWLLIVAGISVFLLVGIVLLIYGVHLKRNKKNTESKK